MGATYLAVATDHPLAKEAALKQPRSQRFIDSCQGMKMAEAELPPWKKGELTQA